MFRLKPTAVPEVNAPVKSGLITITAGKFLTEIDRKCGMLARRPKLGRRRDELAPGLRSFSVGSYVVFYRAATGGVEIIRVLHGARDIESELE